MYRKVGDSNLTFAKLVVSAINISGVATLDAARLDFKMSGVTVVYIKL